MGMCIKTISFLTARLSISTKNPVTLRAVHSLCADTRVSVVIELVKSNDGVHTAHAWTADPCVVWPLLVMNAITRAYTGAYVRVGRRARVSAHSVDGCYVSRYTDHNTAEFIYVDVIMASDNSRQNNSFYRAMLCIRGTSHGPVSVSVCVCVCLSVTIRCSTKTAKRRITQTTPLIYYTPRTLVFWCQISPRNSTAVTPYEGAECRWGGQNRRLLTNDCLFLENGKR